VFHDVVFSAQGRSLIYFEDAEADADPFLFEQITWEQVKQQLVKAVTVLQYSLRTAKISQKKSDLHSA
jgi:hypothetical protein